MLQPWRGLWAAHQAAKLILRANAEQQACHIVTPDTTQNQFITCHISQVNIERPSLTRDEIGAIITAV